MPNGVRRQRNTRHSNRQRQTACVQAVPVGNDVPAAVVVQAEEVVPEDEITITDETRQELIEMCNEVCRERMEEQNQHWRGVEKRYRETIRKLERDIANIKKLYSSSLSEIKGMEDAMDEIAVAAGVPGETENFGHYKTTINYMREKLGEADEIEINGERYILDNQSYIVYNLDGEPKFNAEMNFTPYA